MCSRLECRFSWWSWPRCRFLCCCSESRSTCTGRTAESEACAGAGWGLVHTRGLRVRSRLGVASLESAAVPPQGYERVRRASEDDNSTVQFYDDDEEEGPDEITRREAAPKQVRRGARKAWPVSDSPSKVSWICSLTWQTCCCTRPFTPSSTAWAASQTQPLTSDCGL